MGQEDNGWIGVDLDGTLAFYDKWRGVEWIGEPIPAMAERVSEWLRKGVKVKIFTARVSTRDGRELELVEDTIKDWCLKHFNWIPEVTCLKDFDMIELWDDRCVQVEKNTGRILGSAGQSTHTPYVAPNWED